MKQISAVLLAISLVAPALGQVHDEPRLEGGRPDLECSEADFQAALAGEYTGPPCRFRPDSDVTPAAQPVRPAAQPAMPPRQIVRAPDVRQTHHATSTGSTMNHVSTQDVRRSASTRTTHQPVTRRVRDARPSGTHVRTGEYSHSGGSYRSSGSTYRSSSTGSSYRPSTGGQTHLRSYGPTTQTHRRSTGYRSTASSERYSASGSRSSYRTSRGRGESVQLGEHFFRGGLTGGVGSQPVVVYPNNIIITATGEYYLGFPGAYRNARLPRRVEERPYRPRPVMPTRRAYP